MIDYSDNNDEDENRKFYDYFEDIGKEQNMNPELFSDPFIEIDELKFKNQLLFDKISSISAPSYTYRNEPSELNFSDDQFIQDQYESQQISSSQKMRRPHNKKKITKSDINAPIPSYYYPRTKKAKQPKSNSYRNIPKGNESYSFPYFSDTRQHSISTSAPLSFKERYNMNLNPRRSKPPEKNIIKKATEMQEKLVKMKKENEKLNRNYRSMLYKVEKTRNDVEILKDALATSHFERLVLGHYEWSNYAEKSF